MNSSNLLLSDFALTFNYEVFVVFEDQVSLLSSPLPVIVWGSYPQVNQFMVTWFTGPVCSPCKTRFWGDGVDVFVGPKS